MANTIKPARKSARDMAYYAQRYRNRVHAKLVSWVADQLEKNELTKKDVAEILNRDPAQITRWLAQPSNLSLDTVSLFALAFDAEPEPPDFVEFSERAPANYIHPLIARITGRRAAPVAGAKSTEWDLGKARNKLNAGVTPNAKILELKIANG